MSVAKRGRPTATAVALPGETQLSIGAIALDGPTTVMVTCSIPNEPKVVFCNDASVWTSGPHKVGVQETRVTVVACLKDAPGAGRPRPPTVHVHGDVKEAGDLQFQVDWVVPISNAAAAIPGGAATQRVRAKAMRVQLTPSKSGRAQPRARKKGGKRRGPTKAPRGRKKP